MPPLTKSQTKYLSQFGKLTIRIKRRKNWYQTKDGKRVVRMGVFYERRESTIYEVGVVEHGVKVTEIKMDGPAYLLISLVVEGRRSNSEDGEGIGHERRKYTQIDLD
jgi:hypothetical protein